MKSATKELLLSHTLHAGAVKRLVDNRVKSTEATIMALRHAMETLEKIKDYALAPAEDASLARVDALAMQNIAEKGLMMVERKLSGGVEL